MLTDDMDVDDTDNLSIDHFLVGPANTNIYLIGCKATGLGAVVDAGEDADRLLDRADERDLEIDKILQTHAHFDHVGALSEVEERTGAPIYLHPDEHEMYQAAPRQAQMFGARLDPLPEVDVFVEEGDTVELGETTAEVIHLPGHSPGGIAYHFADEEVVFSGDILFAGSIGRTDLPGADPEAMEASLERLADLPDATRVLSGHGPETTVGEEVRRNPFLN